jgi:hypothetical protein
MLSCLGAGDRERFFTLWEERLPPSVRESDSTCAKLEFYLRIYFAVLGVHPHVQDKPEVWREKPVRIPIQKEKEKPLQFKPCGAEAPRLLIDVLTLFAQSYDTEGHMTALRQFLEKRGAALSKTAEFLPFYALPHVPEPHLHPSFGGIFTVRTVRPTTLYCTQLFTLTN